MIPVGALSYKYLVTSKLMAGVAVLLAAQPIAVLAAAPDVRINASAVLHAANPLYMGCHSDSGFVHEVTGWSSQMLFGESFERPPNATTPGQSAYAWQNVIDGTLLDRAEVLLDRSNNFSGWPSMGIRISAGSAAGSAGVANRGLGNEGLSFKEGMPYEGYFFAYSEQPVTFEVRIMGGVNFSEPLAVQRIAHSPAGAKQLRMDSKANPKWVRHTFSLTPSKGTDCVGIVPGSDPTVHCTNNPGTAHVCVKCGGQFVVAVVANETYTAANVAYVVLQPGAWGRFQGLNARKDVADTMTRMGVKAIRLGGSFCSVTPDDGAYYQWQRWTGPVWDRPSIGAHWDSYDHNAYNLIGGWGPFEMIDYAAALGAEPIITTTRSSTPDELADLVEYCWGNLTTKMGAKRASDGHAEPYRLRYVELGNEEYNSAYIKQVAAMEARAKSVGAPPLYYMFPSNDGLSGDDVAAAAALGLGGRLVTDLHVGGGGALGVAQSLFAQHAKGGLTDDSAVNFETNAGTHDLGRALDEASDLNDFFNAGDRRMLARTASFCHGRAGHFDEFDQAISFFLPNMTWLQPPGHVHAMIHESWQPWVLNTSISVVPPPSWTIVREKAITCSSSEYQGTAPMLNNSAAGCLAAAEKMGGQGVNYVVYPGNANCYVCSIAGDISSRLEEKPGATSYVGKNVVQQLSVSSQRSADGTQLVARIVNRGQPRIATIGLSGFVAAKASAVALTSDKLTAENTAANVEHVTPKELDARDCMSMGDTVTVALPGLSFTIVTMHA